MSKQKRLLIPVCLLLCLFAAGCSTLIASLSQPDSFSATQTALATQPAAAPTLDLKGNKVVESSACEPYRVVCISILEDRPNGGIMAWADGSPKFSYVEPSNHYWAWFSGDAVVLDFSEDAAVQEHSSDKQVIPPRRISTSGLHVFGDFAFSPDNRYLAFVALRQSEKLYTVEVASLSSELSRTLDLFPDLLAETDEYSSDKSVIEWVDNTHLRVSSSCGIDCENIYEAEVYIPSNESYAEPTATPEPETANTDEEQEPSDPESEPTAEPTSVPTATLMPMVLEDQVRKNDHNGRVVESHVIDYDARYYPVMNQPNWSADESMLFYTDNRDQVWVVNDVTKEQFRLDIPGDGILQTLWSSDNSYLAVRYDDHILIIRVNC